MFYKYAMFCAHYVETEYSIALLPVRGIKDCMWNSISANYYLNTIMVYLMTLLIALII
jgi:hypothetical protein